MVLKDITQYPNAINSRNTSAYHDSEVNLGVVNTFQVQPMTFSFDGNYKILLFHVNKEYTDAINASGGTSLNLTNPSTNIVNGLGIFTAMRADTLRLKIQLQ